MKKTKSTTISDTTKHNIIFENISDALKKNAKTYADEANLRRAFPNVLSGLKPVQQHIIWAMYAGKHFHDKPYVKSAIVEGDCFKYSEHGSAYGAAARLAKSYVYHIPFIDGKGNFGAAVSNPYEAASRYTEMRLSEFTEDTLFYNTNLIEMGLNYLENLPEPIMNKWVSKLPLLFMNVTEGMGYPIANRWSSCNLKELRDQIELYIKTKTVDCNSIYPDFPTGGIIINKSELSSLYSEGKGTIKLRGKVEIENDTIKILSLPYGSFPEDFIEDFRNKVYSTANTIKDLRNKCGAKGFLIEIDCDPGTAEYTLQMLYKKTCLQTTYSENRKAIMPDGTIKLITLLDYIKIYVEANIELIKKESTLALNLINNKLEIIDGLLNALDIIDEIITDIKSSKTIDESKKKIKMRGFTENQADAIVSMRLGRLANLEQIKLNKEKVELEKNKKRHQKIIDSKKEQEKVFLKQLNEAVNKYGWERKTEVIDIATTNIENPVKISKPQQLKPKKEFMIVLTSENCLKRIDIMKFRQTDEDKKTLKIQGNQKIVLISNKGTMYKVWSNSIDKCLPTASGSPIVNIKPEINNEKIIAIYSEDVNLPLIYFVTKNGIGKLGEVKNTINLNKTIGMTVCGLKSNDDEILFIKLLNPNNKIEIITSNNCKKIIELDIPQGRIASGKKVIQLKDNEFITEVHSI